MTKPYYVVLSGSKTNSGDHLIRDAALNTFKIARPDRDVIDFNGWEKFDAEKLKIVNNAMALILLGGPALRMDTYPNVYPLVDDLNDIKVPIISLGIGYRHQDGDWEKTKNFEFTAKTLQLLNRIENSGYVSSVRCYNTLNTLLHKGFKKFKMGGCPAFYQSEFIGKAFPDKVSFGKIAFATGRMYLKNDSLLKQEQDLIKDLSIKYKNQNFVVAFHDPIDRKNSRTNEFIVFLDTHKINYIDISGTADNLINFYKEVDLQIGYRVHAHIFMTSINKPSVLLAEDGRGVGMKHTLGALIFEAYKYETPSVIQRVQLKLGKDISAVKAHQNVFSDIIFNLEHEQHSNFVRSKITRLTIDELFKTHLEIIKQLP
jgi:hypothetical protein